MKMLTSQWLSRRKGGHGGGGWVVGWAGDCPAHVPREDQPASVAELSSWTSSSLETVALCLQPLSHQASLQGQ